MWRSSPGDSPALLDDTMREIETFLEEGGWQVVPVESRMEDYVTEPDLVVGLTDDERVMALPVMLSYGAGYGGAVVVLVPRELPDGWRDQIWQALRDRGRSVPTEKRSVGRPGCEAVENMRQPTATSSGRHVFISYSRHDQTYVNKLVSRLRTSGMTAWIDKTGIDYGARWTTEVRTALDSCGACVVVMTPAAEQSDWVETEIHRAKDQGKPIFPLLLDGKSHFLLVTLQYEDVTGGKMPSDRWLEQVRARL